MPNIYIQIPLSSNKRLGHTLFRKHLINRYRKYPKKTRMYYNLYELQMYLQHPICMKYNLFRSFFLQKNAKECQIC